MSQGTRPDAILLIGPTGAGKTPLGRVAEACGFHDRSCRHFDFGACLRARRDATGHMISPEARTIIHAVLTEGRLLEPREGFVACEILQDWTRDLKPGCVIVLNGLPRTLSQAKDLAAIVNIRQVLQLTASDNTILERISNNSGGDRSGRDDDAPDAVRKRLETYRRQTKPLVDHYRHHGIPVVAREVNGNTDPSVLWASLPPFTTGRENAAASRAETTDHAPPPTQGNILSPSDAARILRSGGVVAVPTETVYGLAANALNPTAVERIFTIKRRPSFDPLIVHVLDQTRLDRIVTDWPSAAEQLARACWPGPLTMVLPKHPDIPDAVTAQLPTVAVRAPAHPVIREILAQCDCPLAAPSANRFGSISPTTAQHVADSLGHEPDGIVDGGPCAIGLESTIIAFGQNQIWLLRPGAITPETITQITGLPVERYKTDATRNIPAPGMLPRHYAPVTPLAIAGTPDADTLQGQRLGLLTFGPPAATTTPYAITRNLSQHGDLAEAARSLYDCLRYLDGLGLDGIIADPLPATGIGIAINDRIRRAACK